MIIIVIFILLPYMNFKMRFNLCFIRNQQRIFNKQANCKKQRLKNY
ncbi:hypothetical protein pb186bvf_009048 [Paramecium bursaria]